ncbi:MAG TPA: VOC family protein [Myxococcota bacterium]|jgi:catechol 2,3-dioxygenase-like lactoylglutathione lyase family enzyme|nr:VOC family protein [Myxococcota bacterium]
MIDHVSMKVRDYARSKAFYSAALAPIGYAVVREYPPHAAGFGTPGRPDFWIVTSEAVTPTHVAFAGRDHATVAAFHVAALAAGGADNGGPGTREQYHPHYYGAFVHDPDGNNVEVVCHSPHGHLPGGAPPDAPKKSAAKAKPKAKAGAAKAKARKPARGGKSGRRR